jgi:hypothetical protein
MDFNALTLVAATGSDGTDRCLSRPTGGWAEAIGSSRVQRLPYESLHLILSAGAEITS